MYYHATLKIIHSNTKRKHIQVNIIFINRGEEGGRRGGRETEEKTQRHRETETERQWFTPPRWPSGKASASRVEDPGFESRMRRDFFSGSSHTSDSKIGTPVDTLPGAWCYRVSPGTGRPGVSILGLGEIESLICNFYLSVAARKIV